MHVRPARAFVASAILAAAVAVPSRAGDEDGYLGAGTRVGNGSRVTTAIGEPSRGIEDVDEFVFEGVVGQDLSARAVSRSGLVPEIHLRRPDGSYVDEDDGAVLRPSAQPRVSSTRTDVVAFRLDATGAWTLRVVGDSRLPTPVGTYTLSVKLSRPPATIRKFLTPDGDGRVRCVVPGVAGGTMRSKLTWRQVPAPVFESLRSADGIELPGFAETVETTARSLTSRRYVFPEGLPPSDCVLTFRFDPAYLSRRTAFRATLERPRFPGPHRTRLQTDEPLVTAVSPFEGGPGTLVTVTGTGFADEYALDGAPRVLFGRFPATDVTQSSATTLMCRAPANLPEGTFDVRAESTSGQAAVLPKAFRRLPPPQATGSFPVIASSLGGFDVTIFGTGFHTAPGGTRVDLVDTADGSVVPQAGVLDSARQSDVRLVLRVPEGAPAVRPGVFRIRVTDLRSGLTGTSPDTLEITDRALVSRVLPGLVPILGGETVAVEGVMFGAGDEVHLEDAPGSGAYSAVATTFLDSTRLTFDAPARPKGTYRVKVLALGEFTPEASFTYFAFADLTAALGDPGGGDPRDGTSTAVADMNGDGAADLVLARALTGVVERQAKPQTRVLLNGGAGALLDVASGPFDMMPPVTEDDDWRADRVACADVNGDGWTDLVLTTNSRSVPAAARSHTRILVNEVHATSPSIRVLRDRTADLMPPPRVMRVLYGQGVVTPDPWRGLDLWVGDLDRTGEGPPEIVLTHDETKEDLEVGCAAYCETPYAAIYTYGMYWGGSRLFVWDRYARGGLGRYKFEHRFFPRKAGVTVQTFNPPPGVAIPVCNGGACRGKFTPFAGTRLAVGDLDGDERPDVAVLSSTTTLPGDVPLATPLQVALTRVVQRWPTYALEPTALDVTSGVPDPGVGDAVAIGRVPSDDGTQSGVVAVAQAVAPATGSALRLWRYRPGALPTDAGDFEELPSSALPDPLPTGDALQASVLRFLDVDEDGDDDLVLLADAPPGGTGLALRVLRSGPGVFRDSLRPLLEAVRGPTSEPFDGASLAIGDLDRDGALDFVVTRAAAGTPPATRAIRIDR